VLTLKDKENVRRIEKSRQFYSFDYQMHKSNPDFFKRLLNDLEDYDIENLLFIDDSLSKLESAAKNGIQGILFQNNEQVKKVFEKFINLF